MWPRGAGAVCLSALLTCSPVLASLVVERGADRLCGGVSCVEARALKFAKLKLEKACNPPTGAPLLLLPTSALRPSSSLLPAVWPRPQQRTPSPTHPPFTPLRFQGLGHERRELLNLPDYSIGLLDQSTFSMEGTLVVKVTTDATLDKFLAPNNMLKEFIELDVSGELGATTIISGPHSIGAKVRRTPRHPCRSV